MRKELERKQNKKIDGITFSSSWMGDWLLFVSPAEISFFPFLNVASKKVSSFFSSYERDYLTRKAYVIRDSGGIKLFYVSVNASMEKKNIRSFLI